MALGLTQTLPDEDRYSLNREQIRAMIKHAMGGRAAEDLVFDQFSTGAEDDLRKATDLARRMICKYGMSERIGPVSYGDDDHDVFLGRDFMTRKDYSEQKAQEIDEEISDTLRSLYDGAKTLLADNRVLLDNITEALLERETLDAKDLKALVAGEPLPAPPPVPVDQAEPPPRSRNEQEVEPRQDFPGKKVPDPEPIPG
jgi:cell division protease FtsH